MKLTSHKELGHRDLVLNFALVQAFVLGADIRHPQTSLFAILDAKVFRVVDVDWLKGQKHLLPMQSQR